jgi:hypothetical protein
MEVTVLMACFMHIIYSLRGVSSGSLSPSHSSLSPSPSVTSLSMKAEKITEQSLAEEKLRLGDSLVKEARCRVFTSLSPSFSPSLSVFRTEKETESTNTFYQYEYGQDYHKNERNENALIVIGECSSEKKDFQTDTKTEVGRDRARETDKETERATEKVMIEEEIQKSDTFWSSWRYLTERLNYSYLTWTNQPDIENVGERETNIEETDRQTEREKERESADYSLSTTGLRFLLLFLYVYCWSPRMPLLLSSLMEAPVSISLLLQLLLATQLYPLGYIAQLGLIWFFVVYEVNQGTIITSGRSPSSPSVSSSSKDGESEEGESEKSSEGLKGLDVDSPILVSYFSLSFRY